MPLMPVMEKPGGIPIVTINPDAWCRRANVGRGKRRHSESAQTQTTRLKDPSGAGKNIRGLRLKPERISTTAREAPRASCKAGCRCGPRSKSRRIPSWRFPLLPRGFISLFGIYEAAPVVCDRRHFFALLAPIPRAKGLAGTAPDPCHSPQPEAPWAPPPPLSGVEPPRRATLPPYRRASLAQSPVDVRSRARLVPVFRFVWRIGFGLLFFVRRGPASCAAVAAVSACLRAIAARHFAGWTLRSARN